MTAFVECFGGAFCALMLFEAIRVLRLGSELRIQRAFSRKQIQEKYQ